MTAVSWLLCGCSENAAHQHSGTRSRALPPTRRVVLSKRGCQSLSHVWASSRFHHAGTCLTTRANGPHAGTPKGRLVLVCQESQGDTPEAWECHLGFSSQHPLDTPSTSRVHGLSGFQNLLGWQLLSPHSQALLRHLPQLQGEAWVGRDTHLVLTKPQGRAL